MYRNWYEDQEVIQEFASMIVCPKKKKYENIKETLKYSWKALKSMKFLLSRANQNIRVSSRKLLHFKHT